MWRVVVPTCWIAVAAVLLGAMPVRAGMVEITNSVTLDVTKSEAYKNDTVVVKGPGVLTLKAHGTYGKLARYSFANLTARDLAVTHTDTSALTGSTPAMTGGGGRLFIDDSVTWAFEGHLRTCNFEPRGEKNRFAGAKGAGPGTVYFLAKA